MDKTIKGYGHYLVQCKTCGKINRFLPPFLPAKWQDYDEKSNQRAGFLNIQLMFFKNIRCSCGCFRLKRLNGDEQV